MVQEYTQLMDNNTIERIRSNFDRFYKEEANPRENLDNLQNQRNTLIFTLMKILKELFMV